MSQESILALLLCSDLYIVIFKLLIFWAGKILGGGGAASCSYGNDAAVT